MAGNLINRGVWAKMELNNIEFLSGSLWEVTVRRVIGVAGWGLQPKGLNVKAIRVLFIKDLEENIMFS